MGRVYLALSPSGRRVAIKVIRADLVEDSHIRQRFAREVAASRAVSGFFAAGVVDADVDADPPWLATAFVPGPTLHAAVSQVGPFPVRSVRALGAALAEALSAVHAAGLIHRDLKPGNILLAPDGPRMIDFGISALAGSTTLTQNQIIGSPGYMSPEQIEGKPVGPPTDVFALGGVLAFAATGSGPFGGDSAASVLYQTVHNPPDLSQVPDELRPLVISCLHKDPAQRPDVRSILTTLTGGQNVEDMFAPGWLPAALADAPAFVDASALGDASTVAVGEAPTIRPPKATVRASASAPQSSGHTRLASASEPAPSGLTLPAWLPPSISRRALLVGALGAAGVVVAAGLTAWRLSGGAQPGGGDDTARGLRWRFATAGTVLSRPRVAGDLVYAASNDGTLYAIATATGQQVWTFPTGAALGSSPLVHGGLVYLGSDDGNLYALDAVTGAQRWAYPTGGIVHSPTAGGGLVYVGSADFNLYALDAVTGTLRWTFATGNDTHSPTLAGDSVYVGSSDTHLYAVDAFSQARRWAYPTSGSVSGAPVVLGGTVYFNSSDGNLYAVQTDTGAQVWKYVGVVSGAGPAVADGIVFSGGDGQSLHAVRASDGVGLWTFPTRGDVRAPMVVGDTVFVGSADSRLYAVATATGTERWSFAADAGVHRVAVVDDVAYFGADDNILYAVRI
jgi:outer membrane protein assembly factor BamB